jgi:hypothetical protein
MKNWKDLSDEEKIKLIKKVINALFRWIIPLGISLFCIFYIGRGYYDSSLRVGEIIFIIFSVAVAWYAFGVIGSWIEELIKGIINIKKLKKQMKI